MTNLESRTPATAADVMLEAMDAALPILREIEPGEPESFLSATTLLHELEQRGWTLAEAAAPQPAEAVALLDKIDNLVAMDISGHPLMPAIARVVGEVRAALATPAPASSGLDAAWQAVEKVLPKSKGRWGYSIGSLTYGPRGWCAVAQGERTEEHAEGYGATPSDALHSLAARLRDTGAKEQQA